MNCQSCGMPMAMDSDHGGGRPDNPYCMHCADAAGNLKSREEVKEGMIAFYMQSMGKAREEAEREVDAHMAQMPAWAADRPAWAQAGAPPEPQVPVEPQVLTEPQAPTTPVEPVPETPTAPPSLTPSMPPAPSTEETAEETPVEPPTGAPAGPAEPTTGEQTK